MGIQGFRHTGNFETDARPKSWREGVLLRYPNGMAPLFALTNLMKSESVTDPEFYWWEKEVQSRRYTLNEDLDNSETEITILGSAASALELRPGDVLRAEATGEHMFVTAVTDLNTITVTRGFAGTAATSIDVSAVNPYLLLIGSVFEEGSDAPDGRNWDATKVYNVTQIFRDTLEMTRTAKKTRLRTGDQVKEAKREAFEMHQIAIERALLFGQKWEGTLNGKPARATGGILSFIPTANKLSANAQSTTGKVDMDYIEETMLKVFAFGSNEKMGFCGNRFLTTLNSAVRKNSSYQIFAKEKEFGMNVTRVVCPHGTLVLKTHPMYNQVTGGTPTDGGTFYGLDSACTILDAGNLRYRYFEGDDMRYEQDLQDNGIDGSKSGYLTECGLELHHAKTHFHLDKWVTPDQDA